MASRRYRSKNTLNSNISDIGNRLQNLETRPSPRRIAANAIGTAQLQEEAVGEGIIAPGVIEGASIAGGAVGSAQIQDLIVTAEKIFDGAITTIKIAEDAITEAQLAANSVTSTIIAVGAVVNEKLAADAVTSAKIANGAIEEAKIAANAVTSTAIAVNAVVNSKLAADAVTSEKIAANAVTSAEIAANAVTSAAIAANAVVNSKLAANAVSTVNILANAIDSTKIAANAITDIQLAANAVDSLAIAPNAVVVGKIAANAVDSTALADAAVGNTKIAANAIYGNVIQANAITASKIDVGAVTANAIAANAVTANAIAANAVTANAILANSITGVKIAANTITGNNILAGSVAGDRITANTLYGNTIVANTLSGNSIIANTLSGNTVVANTLHGNSVVANTINGNTLIANSLYGNTIVANTLNGNTIVANSLSGNTVIANTLHGNTIFANTLHGNSVVANSLNGNVVIANSLYGNTVVVNTLSGNTIVANTLSGNTIVSNTLHGNTIFANTLHGNSVVANSLNGNTVIANSLSGNTVIANTLRGNTIIANTISGNTIIANTLSGNTIIANSLQGNTVVANTLFGNAIVAGSITGDRITATTTIRLANSLSVNPPNYIQFGHITLPGATSDGPGIFGQYASNASFYLGGFNTGTTTLTVPTQTPSGTTNITLTVSATHGIVVGETIEIANVTPIEYNGTWVAQTGTTGSTLVISIGFNPGAITVAGDIYINNYGGEAGLSLGVYDNQSGTAVPYTVLSSYIANFGGANPYSNTSLFGGSMYLAAEGGSYSDPFIGGMSLNTGWGDLALNIATRGTANGNGTYAKIRLNGPTTIGHQGVGVSTTGENTALTIGLTGATRIKMSTTQIQGINGSNVASSLYINPLGGTVEVGSSTSVFTVIGYSRIEPGNAYNLTSTNHPFQIGLTSGDNVRMDTDGIQAVSNGSANTLNINTFGGTINAGSSTSTFTVNGYLRVDSTNDASLSSTTHGFQIGPNTGINLRLDTNEIQGVNNGSANGINLQASGGNTVVGAGGGDLIVGTVSTNNSLILGSTSGAPLTNFFYKWGYSSNIGTARALSIASTGLVGYTTSTRDSKEYIEDLLVDVSSVLSVVPKQFKYKVDLAQFGDAAEMSYGFIAEDLHELGLTPFVDYDETGKPFGIDYPKYVVALQAVVAHQASQIQSLSDRLDALEA